MAGFAYATRPNRGWFKKSGNLWFGYQVSYGDYILLLDADFAPRHDLLDETLPYMEAYPDTGIVQTPQYFRIADDDTGVFFGLKYPRTWLVDGISARSKV